MSYKKSIGNFASIVAFALFTTFFLPTTSVLLANVSSEAVPYKLETSLEVAKREALAILQNGDAHVAYERLLEKYPKNVMLYQSLAGSYVAPGDSESARYFLERYRQLDGDVTPE